LNLKPTFEGGSSYYGFKRSGPRSRRYQLRFHPVKLHRPTMMRECGDCVVSGGCWCSAVGGMPSARSLHSSTVWLIVSAFCGIGVENRVVYSRGCVGVTRGYLGGFRVHFVSETAEVELRNGRV
jgi:hypothetical protein